jgi:hypothetical protein
MTAGPSEPLTAVEATRWRRIVQELPSPIQEFGIRFIHAISARHFPADRALNQRSGNDYKFLGQPVGISALLHSKMHKVVVDRKRMILLSLGEIVPMQVRSISPQIKHA